MTAQTQSIKRKLSLLQLAEELGNVAKAAQIMGFHRHTFYEVRKAFQSGGVAALVEHRNTKVRNPRTNGFFESALTVRCWMSTSPSRAVRSGTRRLGDTGRSAFMLFYNTQRTHRGYCVQGRTPA